MVPFFQQTLDFLVENRLRNSREWFRTHKEQYQKFVLEPFVELAARLGSAMLELDPLLVVEPRVDRTISRIYRDIRFARDKSLYRDVMWCAFQRDRKVYGEPPGFVFELSPTGFRWGCGYYQASPGLMRAMRELILEGARSFQRAQAAVGTDGRFAVEGDRYKRSPCPDRPEELRDWLDRRCISLMHSSRDFDLLFSGQLCVRLEEDFRRLEPVYDFFWEAERRARL